MKGLNTAKYFRKLIKKYLNYLNKQLINVCFEKFFKRIQKIILISFHEGGLK